MSFFLMCEYFSKFFLLVLMGFPEGSVVPLVPHTALKFLSGASHDQESIPFNVQMINENHKLEAWLFCLG